MRDEADLKELRRADGSADFFDAYRAERRNPKHGTKFLGGFGDSPFPVMMKQPLKRRRGPEQGHGQLLPHDVVDMSMPSTPARTLGTKSHRS